MSHITEKTGQFFVGTVGLDRNRWGSRVPAFQVSDWLDRFKSDGFDGVELWEFHYLAAEEAERGRLESDAAPVAVFNTYAGLADADAEARDKAAKAITRLQAAAVKYNLGGDSEKLEEYRRNLLAWSEQLPADCTLLCECHPGTVLEEVDAACAFHSELDPGRFGAIAHLDGNPERATVWAEGLGDRIQHLHIQLRTADSDPSLPENRKRLETCFQVMKKNLAVPPSVTMEFSRGIGKNEEIETIYANTCSDMCHCKDALQRA